MALTGTHHVRALRSALQKAKRTWPQTGPRMEVRRQALKLRYWGERHTHGNGMLCDLTYESIKALSGSGIYELRLDDEIGGQENIRVIFLEPPDDWTPNYGLPLPPLWVIEAVVKKRNGWTSYDLARFRAGRTIVQQRFYT